MPKEFDDGIEYLEPGESYGTDGRVPGDRLTLVHRPSNSFMPVMSIDEAVERRNSIISFVNKILTEGINDDYGEIPGSKKKVLFKAGAEKLANFFGLSPHYERVDEKMDLSGKDYGEPFYYIAYKCTLVRNGQIMGQGEGSANSHESKYRYRWVQEKDLPYGIDKDSLPKRGGVVNLTEFEFGINKAETTGKYGKPTEYWERFRRAIESGEAKAGERDTARGKSKTWTISEDATLFRINNPEMPDIINTCQKISQKRAFVCAVLGTTGASQFFTQDLLEPEEVPGYSSGEPRETSAQVAERRISEERAKILFVASKVAAAASSAAVEEQIAVNKEDLTVGRKVKTTETEKAIQPEIMPDDTNKEAKSRNRALLQRILKDMDIEESNKKDLLTEYYLGFLGLNILPSGAPGLFEIPLKALDEHQTHHTKEARADFINRPRKLGEELRTLWTQQH